MTDVSLLPSPPYNVDPIVLGDPNDDPARLVEFRFYCYQAGQYLGDAAWVTGSDVDRLLDTGSLLEELSANSKHLLALDSSYPAAESNVPTEEVTDETDDDDTGDAGIDERDVDELIALGDDDDDDDDDDPQSGLDIAQAADES
jgi:hypothetical protein